MTVRRSPTVRRRRLGLELRRLRESAGVTIDVVADRLECSSSKISRIETGHTGATTRDVRDMLAVYGVDGAAADELVQVMDRPYRDLRPRHEGRNANVDVEPTLRATKHATHDREILALRLVEVIPGTQSARFLVR